MTDQQTVQDTPAPNPLPPPPKQPSIRPQKTLAEIIGRTIVDLVALAIVGAAMLTGKAPYYYSYGVILLLVGVRISDIATIRQSGGSDPPIAGGLAGALFALISSRHS